MLIENIGWFFFGAGMSIWVMILYNVCRKILDNRANTTKFDKMIEDLRKTSAVLSDITEMASPVKPEVSELSFRDSNGKLDTVKIIVDHNADPEQPHDGLAHEFIFSAKVVDRMRASGIEPDEVVTSILRASGRIL